MTGLTGSTGWRGLTGLETVEGKASGASGGDCAYSHSERWWCSGALGGGGGFHSHSHSPSPSPSRHPTHTLDVEQPVVGARNESRLCPSPFLLLPYPSTHLTSRHASSGPPVSRHAPHHQSRACKHSPPLHSTPLYPTPPPPPPPLHHTPPRPCKPARCTCPPRHGSPCLAPASPVPAPVLNGE